jgi:hypothetical protein
MEIFALVSNEPAETIVKAAMGQCGIERNPLSKLGGPDFVSAKRTAANP